MGPGFESLRADHLEGTGNSEEGRSSPFTFHCSDNRIRPVGQVVKTVASHAINIGSNPVRVTKNPSRASAEDFYLFPLHSSLFPHPRAWIFGREEGIVNKE